MANNAANEGSQKVVRESDTVVVPEIVGNAKGGKDGTQGGLVQGTHLGIMPGKMGFPWP